jgi:peptidoglycan/xylan/chitin deacetylase (PgdA/CDA1 family)
MGTGKATRRAVLVVGRKRIALTIDDGPSPEYTPQVLRLLEKYRVTATFSMIGLEVDAHPLLPRLLDAGYRFTTP